MTLQRLVNAVLRRIMWGIGFFLPIKKNKVLVSSYYGRGYGDNPKYIVEELLHRNADCQIIWLVSGDKEKETLPQGVKGVRNNSVAAAYHRTTAKVWIDNCRGVFEYKKKKQYYIQTWHGFALKRIERDVQEHLMKGYVKGAKKDSKAINLIVSEGRFMTQLYRNAFWYNGEIAQWGSPRNDILAKAENAIEARQKLCKHFALDEDVKIVLYAPTFRANHSLEPYNMDYARVKAVCEKKFGSKFKVLVRLHPGIMERSRELQIDGISVLDASGYVDMQELLAAADIVISDYSSLMFDFALSGKPCFQYATDIEDYKADRNFYFRLDKLPFSVSENNDALEENILRFDYDTYKQNLDAFLDEVGLVRTGDASKKCADLIEEICKDNR